MIDLKQKTELAESEPVLDNKKEYYPCAYLRDIEGIDDLKTGQEIKLVGKVTAVIKSERDGKKSHSIEVDLTGLDDGKTTKTDDKSTKTTIKDDEDAIDKGIDDEIEKEEKE